MAKNKKHHENQETYAWTPEKMLKMMMNGKEIIEDNWLEEGLPKIIDEILTNYDEYGGINHLEGNDLPSKQVVIEALDNLLTVIFPGYAIKLDITRSNIRYYLGNVIHSVSQQLVMEIEKSLKYLCRRIKKCPEDVCLRRAQVVVKELIEKIPLIRTFLKGDIQAAYDGDPAAKSIDEVILSYPCVLAIATYRIAHELYVNGIPFVPRIMTEYAHSKTGIDIHPGAKIGKNFFIDHGTGVVIGETAEINDNVKIYQGVTLGALSFPKDRKGRIIKGRKRHPTIGKNVVIYGGATLLGADAVVGDNAVIGGNVWITSPIPPGTKITITEPDQKSKKRK